MFLVSIVSGVLLLVGLALFICGVCARRIGDTRYCRTCCYNWTDLVGGRCPECGTEATPNNVEIGVRSRRAKLWAPGLVLTLLCGTWLGLVASGTFNKIDWYPHYPQFMLVSKGQAGDVAAINELQRRFDDDEMDADEAVQLVCVALAASKLTEQEHVCTAWLQYVLSVDVTGLLSDEQRKQFCDAVVTPNIEIRPKVRQGDELSPWIVLSRRGRLGLRFDAEVSELRIGEHPHGRKIKRSGGLLLGNPGFWGPRSLIGNSVYRFSSSRASEPLLPEEVVVNDHATTVRLKPGVYAVRIDASFVFTLYSRNGLQRTSLSRNERFVKQIEILPCVASDTVVLVKDDKLDKQFLEVFPNNPMLRGDPPELYLAVRINRLPMDAVLKLIAVADEQEYELKTLILRACESNIGSIGVRFPVPDVESAVPVLRTDVECARATHDVFRIWDGEVRFDPIRLKRKDYRVSHK